VGSTRRRSQAAESGRSDSGRSAAVFAKLGSAGRIAGEAGPGHVGIAGSRRAGSRIARVGWARHTGGSSRADMGVASSTRGTRHAGRRLSGTPSDMGIAAFARGTGPGGAGAKLGRAFVFAAACPRTAYARFTSVGIAGRPTQGRHSYGAVLEPASSSMEPTPAGGVSTGGARLHGLGPTPSCGSGATADCRTVVE
jgi:hypothetical protein